MDKHHAPVRVLILTHSRPNISLLLQRLSIIIISYHIITSFFLLLYYHQKTANSGLLSTLFLRIGGGGIGGGKVGFSGFWDRVKILSSGEDMEFEETELRLGLPGNGGGGGGGEGEVVRKRGFSETMDLKLNLSTLKESGGGAATVVDLDEKVKGVQKEKNLLPSAADPAKPPAKAQVVGWPPVRSFRKNILATQKSMSDDSDKGAAFVKVSMDGAPYLRKVDLRMYKTYQDLYDALGKMFSSFTIGNCGSQGMKDFMNESKLMDLLNGSDYVPTYEDKDGDWMLVGDVPWEMFVESCKRLRIMKGTEAIGLAPRAMEKCKNRTN